MEGNIGLFMLIRSLFLAHVFPVGKLCQQALLPDNAQPATILYCMSCCQHIDYTGSRRIAHVDRSLFVWPL